MRNRQKNLLFDSFLREQSRLRNPLGQRAKIDELTTKIATRLHIFTVMDALTDAFIRSTSLANVATSSHAQHYLLYGVGRRLSMMRQSYSDVIGAASPERTETLSQDEANQINLALNVIYLNVRGVLDNLAWALLHEYVNDKIPAKQQSVGLFHSCILKEKVFIELSGFLESHRNWSEDLKNRRDPVAHRIPLGVTGQVIQPREKASYDKFSKEYGEAMMAGKLDRADKALSKLYKLGQFMPSFGHDPVRPLVPLYPTVPDDVGRLVMIYESIHMFFERSQTQA